MRYAIAAAGEARVILYGCDSARAIGCGHSLGVTLFQGNYVDTLLKSPAGTSAQPAESLA